MFNPHLPFCQIRLDPTDFSKLFYLFIYYLFGPKKTIANYTIYVIGVACFIAIEQKYGPRLVLLTFQTV